jgi:alpha-amylase
MLMKVVDGLRIDSVQQVDQAFWQPFLSAAGNSIYAVGEVFNGDPNYLCPYQQYVPGLLNYPAYYWITQAFQSTSGSISNLVNGINQLKGTCSDTTLLGSFLENHDNPRFPSLTSDVSLDKNAIGFAMLQDGIPIVYEGQEQHYSGSNVPQNREAIWTSGYSTTSTLYTYIKQLNAIRTWAASKDSTYLTYKAWPIYSDSQTIAIRKGSTGTQVIAVFTNRGSSGSGTATIPSSNSGFTAGQSVTELLTCKTSTADSSGNLAVSFSSGLPLIFYPTSSLSGSSLCSASGATTTAKPSSTFSTSTKSATTATTCGTSATPVSVTFNETVVTSLGQTIKIAGSISQLGSWNTANAVALSAKYYTSSNPLWTGTVTIPAGTTFQYKFINVASNGAVTWEADPNHSYTVPQACGQGVTVSNTWQSS